MGRSHQHQHDLVQRLQQPHPVQHSCAADVKALEGLVDHGLDAGLGHAGVVLQFQAGDAVPVALPVPYRTEKCHHRAHAAIARTQLGDLV
jgi:hypothetical protein